MRQSVEDGTSGNRLRRILAVALIAVGFLAGPVLLSTGPALAVNPDEVLDDPALEARARELSTGLRCLVCQNQSIDDSNAELAKDLRVLVRERLVEGDTNEEVIDYLVSRYGKFVLLKPPVDLGTIALWATPLVVLIAGIGFAVVTVRGRKGRSAAVALSEEEESAIAKVVKTRR